MKKVLFTIACLFSVTAMAQDATPNYPKVAFGSVFVSVDGVCQNGANLQTISPVAVCTQYAGGEAGNCVASQNLILSTPINFTKTIYVGENDKPVEVAMSYALNYNIEYTYGGEAEFVAYTKPFSIPACSK